MAPVKGQRLLVDAIAELAKRGIQLEATIIGDGSERHAVESRAEELGVRDRVHFTGWVGQDEIRSHYEAADVFCLASFAEGVPVVLMEAMAMGRPVVATRVAGVGELVDDGKNGLLVSPGRVDQLAGALARLAQSPELRQSMGAEGRRKVAAEFDVDRAAEALVEIFGGLARNGSEPLAEPTEARQVRTPEVSRA
jgi:glycosyltransferase involved in cell wall biosynthesis